MTRHSPSLLFLLCAAIAIFTACSAGDGHPPVSDQVTVSATPAATPPAVLCQEGSSRACTFQSRAHDDGVHDCYPGTEICGDGGVWQACAEAL